MFSGVIERRVGVARLALAAQSQAAPGVQVDVAGEETSRPAECDMRFKRLIEIFAGDPVQAGRHPGAQGVRKIHLLARNADLHKTDPSPAHGGKRRAEVLGGHGFLPFALH